MTQPFCPDRRQALQSTLHMLLLPLTAASIFALYAALAWIFDGVEIDRYDLMLGMPPHARILATSELFSDNVPLVQEEILYSHPGMGGTQHPGRRCPAWASTTTCRA